MGANMNYHERNLKREQILEEATMSFVAYFMGLGDDKATAEQKVSDLSTEVAIYIYPFVLGNRQPLTDAINASTLPFMDQAAKDKITGDLNVAL